MKIPRKTAALLLAPVLALSLTACGGGEPAQDEGGAQAAGIAVQVETVVQDTIATENKVSGKISADNEAVIMIASTAKCTAVYFEAGDQVEAGDVLCTLELGSALSNYNAARIGYNGAVQSYNDQKAVLDKQVQLAADNVSNTKALFEIGAASQLEVDQAELNYSNAVAGRNSALSQLESSIQSAKSGLAQLDTALENVDADGNVIAPMAGTLVTMSAVENSFISNSMPLAVIDGPDQMKVSVSVSEALVPKLTIGAAADVYVSAIDESFSAVIRSVEQAANVQTRLYTVTLTVPAEVGGLLSGMFADVTFFTDVSQNAVVVPTESILTSGGSQYVFVVENDTARYLEVSTGLTGNGVTEVTSGLTAGQQLVTVGQAYLHEGDPVRVVSGEG
ncbi:efflux RND transporter periplasmic adaptor subunit [uncultured Oscillibacter sp.]|uniref:efflux RND transporter periplasmic adaptor subunit n=1 Tax=uncultured Oscillibacter sp. TaxID=876091 RepID=UPI0025F8C654|nr:efflux RND transporter periplasmic adaptor subunit [uncultured Oscillibacter sp.]